ncbi:hypothetical protein PESP_a1968 [Pseudoalteromonas espejiana DSM 9414]|nr:hypothetical protein PESP_a1968 [Pseudoalteromonas espejiana DSM 9414]
MFLVSFFYFKNLKIDFNSITQLVPFFMTKKYRHMPVFI